MATSTVQTLDIKDLPATEGLQPVMLRWCAGSRFVVAEFELDGLSKIVRFDPWKKWEGFIGPIDDFKDHKNPNLQGALEELIPHLHQRLENDGRFSFGQ